MNESVSVNSGKMQIVRGGVVYFEPGALGGLFVGVFFMEGLDVEEVRYVL